MNLITGATGCIGSALARHLVARGEPVRALVRHGADVSILPPEVEIITGTLEDIASLRSAVQGVTTIFHTAAKVHDARATEEEFQRVNVTGTMNLLQTCGDQNSTPRVLHYSTVAVWGEETTPEGLPEDAPVTPFSPYAFSKVKAERLLQEWGESTGAVIVNLRVATVYGPNDRGNFAKMFEAIEKGRFVLPGGGRNHKTCVAVDNVAAQSLAVANARKETVAGRAFTVADPEGPYTLRTLATEMARALGVERRILSVPVPILLGIAGILEPTGRLTRAQVKRLAAHNVYRAGFLGQITGDVPPISLSEGMVKAAQWWKARKNLPE